MYPLAPLAQTTPLDLFSLSDRALIVTGGARGLGLALATAALQAKSPQIYCLDVLLNPVEDQWKLAEKVASEHGGKTEYRQLDITDEDAVNRTFKDIYEECPHQIGGFYGAAGIVQQIPALEYPVDQFRELMNINVTGRFWVIGLIHPSGISFN